MKGESSPFIALKNKTWDKEGQAREGGETGRERAGEEYKRGGSRKRKGRRREAARARCYKVTRLLPGSWVPIPSPQKHPAGLNWGRGVKRGEGPIHKKLCPLPHLRPSHPYHHHHGSSLSPPLSPLQPSDTPAQANYQALCSCTASLILMCALTNTHTHTRSP